MKRFGWIARILLILLILLAPGASGCVRTDQGMAVRGADTTSTAGERPKPSAAPAEDLGPAAPGVAPTSRAPIPPNTVTCAQSVKPAVSAVAKVPDPAAPTITVAVPDGWSAEPGSGDVGVRLQGPDGMLATVTIAQTQLGPMEAFTEYADQVMAVSPVSSVSVLPAELCGYSGQKLMGVWSDNPAQSVEFLDRIVHIWTNSGDYLIAIHVQAPAATAGFDAAATVLIEDFAVGIP